MHTSEVDFPFWTSPPISLSLPREGPVLYKYVLVKADGGKEWESGPDRKIERTSFSNLMEQDVYIEDVASRDASTMECGPSQIKLDSTTTFFSRVVAAILGVWMLQLWCMQSFCCFAMATTMAIATATAMARELKRSGLGRQLGRSFHYALLPGSSLVPQRSGYHAVLMQRSTVASASAGFRKPQGRKNGIVGCTSSASEAHVFLEDMIFSQSACLPSQMFDCTARCWHSHGTVSPGSCKQGNG